MKLLELCAGSRSIGREAERLGYEVFSTDIEDFEGIHLVKDILEIQKEDIPIIPDVIWASTPCTTFSIAAVSHHRNGTEPKTDAARIGDAILAKVLKIISWFPQAKFFSENPRGMMRKMPILFGIPRVEVTYCSYGDTRMKPTDIWSNHLWSIFNQDGWMPREMCFNGNINCHHEPAPRGSRTGTQGLKGAYERSRIPSELAREILQSARNSVLDSNDYDHDLDGNIAGLSSVDGLA